MTDTAKELLRLLAKYIQESEERMDTISNQVKILTIIDSSILESKDDRK